ncbi:photosystem II reaction centre N prot [Prochlorococcus sp. AH-716-K03]|nr:photosystem II reaction centre N prot [Prochlorococcus sp. AH-716-K03]
MFAIALSLSPLETITIAISASIFVIAFTWVSIKGDLRELANELIDDRSKEDN